MNLELLALARFVLGLVVIAGAFLLIRRTRGQAASNEAWGRLLESRLHYGLVGAVAGATAWPDLQLLFAESAAIAVAFFGAWCGLVIGLGLDLRSLGRSAPALLLLEAGQVALVVAGVLVTTSLLGRALGPDRLPFSGPALLVLAGICAVGVPLRRRSGGGVPDKVGRSGWEPSVSGWVGILLIGLGSTRMHDLAFAVRLPFLPESRALPVDGLVAEALWTLAIGAVTGLVIDLVTRDSDRTELLFIAAGGLAFGGGLAAVLGLEPLWVGVVAGGWVINATLRRLEVIGVADRVHPVMRIGLFFTAGWVLGQGIGRVGIDPVVSLWVFSVIVGLRPVAAVAETRLVQRLLHVPAVKRSRQHDWLGPGQEDLALVAAVGLAVLWDDPAGVGTVLGVLAAVCALRVFRGPRASNPSPE
jgi:hypothetical protein